MQGDTCESDTSPGYISRFCFKNQNQDQTGCFCMNKEVGEKDSEIIQHSRDLEVHGLVTVDWEDS